MVLAGKQKAAMLLMSLDAATAAEMVKGLDPKAVQELALEVAYLDAAGQHNSKQSLELVRQFCNSLQTGSDFHLKTFLKEMLENTVGREKAQNIQNQIEDLLQKRDPFINVRSADSHTIALVLGNEHPQVVAIVLSQLPARKSSEVIGLLGEGVRLSAISRMAGSESITPEARERITQRVCKRIEAAASSASGTIQTRPKQSLRKVAVILRNLGKELRDGLFSAIQEKDEQAAKMVNSLMIVWDDITQVADRSLQKVLRGIDVKRLALALAGADEATIKKIKSNISERTAAVLDEEISLMSSPGKDEISQAREAIVQALREKNAAGELTFIEE